MNVKCVAPLWRQKKERHMSEKQDTQHLNTYNRLGLALLLGIGAGIGLGVGTRNRGVALAVAIAVTLIFGLEFS
jgi:hypothetical protein